MTGLEVALALLAYLGLQYLRRRGRRRPVARRRQPRTQVRPGQGPRCFPPEMRAFILRRDGYRCTNCGQTWDLQVDHVVPYSLGGRTVPSNGKTLCGTCNRLKSNSWAE